MAWIQRHCSSCDMPCVLAACAGYLECSAERRLAMSSSMGMAAWHVVSHEDLSRVAMMHSTAQTPAKPITTLAPVSRAGARGSVA
jgi:hypothetical protein